MQSTSFSQFTIQSIVWTLPHPTTHRKIKKLSPVSTRASSHQVTHSMPPEKLEIFKSLAPWVSKNVLHFREPTEKCWQPSEFLPDPSQGLDGFVEEVRALRQRVLGLSDEYFVLLIANMLGEETLPTYLTRFNTWDGVRDETGSSSCPWAIWSRSWAAEENRHGDLLRTYIYLSGRVDMLMIEKTMQHALRAGIDNKTENNPYLGFVYASIEERATFLTHDNMARLAKEAGDPVLARICETIAADEKRHESAYTRIVEKLLEVDPNTTMLAITNMIKNGIVVPMHLMSDGQDSNMFGNFSAISQRLGVYTIRDYAGVIIFFITRWKLEKLEGLTGEAQHAQDFVCRLPLIIKKLNNRAKQLEPRRVKFSWIFNKEVSV